MSAKFLVSVLVAMGMVGCSPVKPEAEFAPEPAPVAEPVKNEPAPYDGDAAAAYENARKFVTNDLAKSKSADLADWDIPTNSGYGKVGFDQDKKNYWRVEVPGSRKDGKLKRTWTVTLHTDASGIWRLDSLK